MYSGTLNYPAKKYISDGKPATGKLILDEKKINVTGGVRIYYAVTGVNATATTSNNAFDVNVVMSVKITDVITVYCEISSYIKELNYVDSVTTNYFIYNVEHYNRPYFASFYNDDIEGPTYPVLAHFNKSINYPYSTMSAIVGFEIKDANFLDFNIQFSGSDIISVTS